METTRLHAAEKPFDAPPASTPVVLPADVARFVDALRHEHQRFLSAAGDTGAQLGQGSHPLARTAALHNQLTRQFLDAQRSILLRHAETEIEIERIERDAEVAATVALATARRRAEAMRAHPAGSERAPALPPLSSPSAPAAPTTPTDSAALAEIVDLVFQPRESEGATARRQLTELLDSWWVAEQQEARAKIDDAYARAAMRRHVAGVEAAAAAQAVAASGPLVDDGAAVVATAALPGGMSSILDGAAATDLDSVLDALLESLDQSSFVVQGECTSVPSPAAAPLAPGAIIRFEPTPVIATTGSDEAFQRFWTKETVAVPVRRSRWWQHVAIVLPATAVSSLLVAAIAWAG